MAHSEKPGSLAGHQVARGNGFTTATELHSREIAAPPFENNAAHCLSAEKGNFKLRRKLDPSRDAELRSGAR
jgi:hypothetical protein